MLSGPAAYVVHDNNPNCEFKKKNSRIVELQVSNLVSTYMVLILWPTQVIRPIKSGDFLCVPLPTRQSASALLVSRWVWNETWENIFTSINIENPFLLRFVYQSSVILFQGMRKKMKAETLMPCALSTGFKTHSTIASWTRWLNYGAKRAAVGVDSEYLSLKIPFTHTHRYFISNYD